MQRSAASRSTPGRRPTIQDVATAAGVSRAAVSKVIRDAYGVSPAMREKVNGAIAALGYRPSSAARSLRGASFTIGMETALGGNPFVEQIVTGAVHELEGTGYQLVIAPAERDSTEGLRAIEALVDRGVDGIIAVSPLVETPWLEQLAARIPVVMIGRHDSTDAFDTVTSDDRAGARLVMEHLLGAGHTRIAHVTRSEAVTQQRSLSPHALRLEGFLDGMAHAGLSQHAVVHRGGQVAGDTHRAMTEALTAHDRPTAVFAAHDELAMDVQLAALELGLGPEDLAIVGYDDIPIAGHPSISLTSVRQPGHEMGRHAVRLVRERMDGRTEAVHPQFDVELHVRTSSASRTTR